MAPKVIKNETTKLVQKGFNFWKNRSDRVGFFDIGPSKKSLLEDAFKKRLVKNGIAKNGPKLIPKWFKIAQIA